MSVTRVDQLDDLELSSPAARVVVVHDQPLLALGLTMLLREASGGHVAVVGRASRVDVNDAVARLRPNLVLICLGPGTGVDAVRALTVSWPEVRVVVQCSPEDAGLAAACFCVGVAGVLSTDTEPAAVVNALLTVIGGMTVIPSWLVHALPPLASNVHLSTEEHQLWRLLTRGWTNEAIAHALHLSDRTLKRRICLLLCKLAVANRVEAAALGGRLGLLDDGVRPPFLLTHGDPNRTSQGDGHAVFH